MPISFYETHTKKRYFLWSEPLRKTHKNRTLWNKWKMNKHLFTSFILYVLGFIRFTKLRLDNNGCYFSLKNSVLRCLFDASQRRIQGLSQGGGADHEFWRFFSPFSTFFTRFRAFRGARPQLPPPPWIRQWRKERKEK